jgi:predicted ATPase
MTRMAREAARRLEPAFRDGVRWIDLAAIADPALVVLDNGEHVIAPLAVLAARVLAVPAADASPAVIADNPAVRLFAQRARELVGDFRVDASNADVVADICRRAGRGGGRPRGTGLGARPRHRRARHARRPGGAARLAQR